MSLFFQRNFKVTLKKQLNFIFFKKNTLHLAFHPNPPQKTNSPHRFARLEHFTEFRPLG